MDVLAVVICHLHVGPGTENNGVKRKRRAADVWALGRKHRAPCACVRGPSPLDHATDGGTHLSERQFKSVEKGKTHCFTGPARQLLRLARGSVRRRLSDL